MDISNPAHPLSPFNPASPLNPINMPLDRSPGPRGHVDPAVLWIIVGCIVAFFALVVVVDRLDKPGKDK